MFEGETNPKEGTQWKRGHPKVSFDLGNNNSLTKMLQTSKFISISNGYDGNRVTRR